MQPGRPAPDDWSFLFERFPEGIVVFDPLGRILDANPGACEQLGCAREELLRLTLADLLAPGEEPGPARRRGGARHGGRTSTERRLRRKDGSMVAVEGSDTVLAGGRTVVFLRDRSAERRGERAIEHQETMFQALIEKASDVFSIIDPDGTIRYLSPSVARLLGFEPEEMTGHRALEFAHPDDRPWVEAAFHQAIAVGESTPVEVRFRVKGGGWRLLEGVCTDRIDDPAIRGLVVNARDVTDRRRAEEALIHSEEKLRHAHRLESIGRLAGGVAHDFNNLLTVILAYSNQQIAKLEPQHSLYRQAIEIRKAAERAAALTRQLLAFSRRQVIAPRVLELKVLVADLGPMLERLIGEDIDLLVHSGDDGSRVRADRGQIEQVVMNLVVNARDAMPNGGRLAITTGATTLDASRAAMLEGLAPGRYVTLTVSDSGIGMDSETLTHAFEPFFTTKPRGEGTGLGLSTVYGIVQQSGGAIEVESEPGEGSTFTIYLPAVAAEVAAERTEAPSVASSAARASRGGETILLVEDEEMVRSLMAELLEEADYRVLAASGGRAALELAARTVGEIHLLLTDVVMPGMNGRELAERLVAVRPGVRVLYVSGYTQDLIARQGILDPGVRLIQKPFDAETFARQVREALDAPGRLAA